ncbi:MAG: fatty acid desaturase [Pseudomonadota bacterium]
MIANIQALRQRIDEQGCFKQNNLRSFLKLVTIIATCVIGYTALLKLPFIFDLLLILPFSIILMIVFFLGHEAGHQALFSKRSINKWAFLIIFSLIGGVSATYWKYKHNDKHHRAPNVVGEDNDIELWPLALYKDQINHSSPITKFFRKHCQHWAFWFLFPLLFFSMRFDGLIYLFKQRKSLKNATADITLFSLHYLLWLVLPALFFPIAKVIILYVAVLMIAGFFSSIVFIVGHTGLPILKSSDNYWLTVLTTTQNIKLPPLLSWCCTGMDYQIEHHFFPKLNHFTIKKVSASVKQWALENNLPYHETNLFQAMKNVYLTLKHPKTVS